MSMHSECTVNAIAVQVRYRSMTRHYEHEHEHEQKGQTFQMKTISQKHICKERAVKRCFCTGPEPKHCLQVSTVFTRAEHEYGIHKA